MGILSPGAVDYHLANQVGNLSINPQNPCSLTCWISAVINTSTTMSMVGTYNTYTSGGTGIQMGTRSELSNGFTVWTWGGGHLVDTNNNAGGNLFTFTDNVWYHYAYVFDGTYNRLYINGNLINQVNNSTGVSVTTGATGYASQLAGTITAVYVNGYPSGGTSETGTFSFTDISHFNRALSAQEVLSLYSINGPRDGIIYGDVTSYFCGEKSIGSVANSVTDESGNGNLLTPLGAATGVNFTYVADNLSGDARPPL